MAQPREASSYLVGAMLAGGAALIGLTFAPFVGFTERIAFGQTPITRDLGAAGLGTHGEEFNFFGYSNYLVISQVIVVLLAVPLGRALLTCWRHHKAAGTLPTSELEAPAKAVRAVGIAFAVVTAITLFVVFPAVEDETIWHTDSGGFIVDWWPEWGAALVVLGTAAMAWALFTLARRAPGPGDGTPSSP